MKKQTEEKKINAYICEQLHITVTVDRNEGTTPMFMSCPICAGTSTSRMYSVSQNLKPTFEWFKPDPFSDEDNKLINDESTKHHVNQGGLLIREIKNSMPKFERPIIIFDFETTGLDISSDQIIQIGFVKLFSDGRKESYLQLVKPSVPISEEAYQVHKISVDDLENAPMFKDIAIDLFQQFEGCDIGGYNIIRFDLPLLIEEFSRINIPFGIKSRKVFDIYTWYKKHRSQSLGAAYKELFNEEFPDAHDALADAQGTEKVFQAMIRTLPEIGNTTEQWESFNWDRSKLVDLAGKFIRNDIGEIIFNFGPPRGQPVYDNMGMLNWMVGKGFTHDTMKWVYELRENPQLSYSDENRELHRTDEDN